MRNTYFKLTNCLQKNLYKSLYPEFLCPISAFIRSALPSSIAQQFQMTIGMEISMANQNQGTV